MLFLSTYHNKIDKKGRVSVPASFRAVLTKSKSSFSGIVSYSSFINDCIEACSYEQIENLSKIIDNLDPYSEQKDAFATAILGGSVQLPFDNEGRVILPEELIETAKLGDQACFVGKGSTFEIWNPDAFKENYNLARSIAKRERSVLQSQNKIGEKS